VCVVRSRDHQLLAPKRVRRVRQQQHHLPISPVQVHGVGPVGVLKDVSAVSVGSAYACALLATGTVDCWGYNHDEQLGDDTTVNSSTPVSVV